MNELYKEEEITKSYDWKLMKRLLKYAKPYWMLIVVSILLLLLITGLELLNPFLIKITIDDYINGYQKDFIQLPIGYKNKFDGVIIGDSFYSKLEYIDDNELTIENNYPIVNLKKLGNSYFIEQKDSNINTIQISYEDYLKFRKSDISGLDKIALIFAFSIFINFLLSYIQIYILNYTSQKIIFNIREELFNHIQSLSIHYFDNNPIGRLVTRVTNDTETLNEMYTSVLVNLFKDFFLLGGIMIVMIKIDLQLALLSFSLIPVIILISIYFRKYIREIYRLSRLQLAKINSSLNENISGMQTIQLFNKESKFFKNFDMLNKEYLNIQRKEIKYFAIYRPSIEVLRSLGIALLIYFGGGKAISGIIEFGVLYLFINYLQRFFEPILDLTEKYNILQSAMASSERIFQIIDLDDKIKNIDNPVVFKKIKGRIEFKNVWFAYTDKDWVLKDINFIIEPGQSIAIVGATGAGKTSIINLITRFYDIQKGEILIDGVNIKNIDKESLRRHVGVVLQDVFIFTGTIKDNIRLNSNINDDSIIEISKYINCHEFITKLPNSYDEPVMERGSTLSSGQKQLLSFARTLVYNPDILILDEATSNIDTDTEQLIQDALFKLTKDRTSIAIAHRLSTIQHSDNIIVLKDGIIKELGNHQELLIKRGLYYNLYKLQYKDQILE
ncbi:MAG: ABC transporter ATP-binding protein [Gudongella sp.]|nr:ABC transporter ATP-binding protein [Gudongella sp.]